MKRGGRIFFGIVRAAIGIALLVYLGTSGAIEWTALLGLLAAWPLTLAAFVILVADMFVTAWRLCVLLRPRGLELSLVDSARLMLIGIFFNACLPGSTGGDVVKIYYATQGNTGRRTEVATVLLLDRATGMFALLLWPLLIAPLFPDLLSRLPILQALLWGALVAAAAVLLGSLICFSPRMQGNRILLWAFRRLPLGGFAERIFDTVHSYGRHWRALLAAVGISLIAHTLSVGITLLIAEATGPAGAAGEMAVLIPLGHLANVLPLTPGGLGVGEAAFDQLFLLAGYDGGAEAMLGWRVLTLALGLVGLLFYLRARDRYIHAAEEIRAADRPA